MSMTELGQEIGLSTSPVAERVKRLERRGVIPGYHARVNPAAQAQSPSPSPGPTPAHGR